MAFSYNSICSMCFFRLHGSSIGVYNYYFPTVSDQKEDDRFDIVGADRSIRTDEWAVQVPTFFSQYYNDYGVTSNRMSVGDENMILDYFAPAKCIITLGKPLNWGYILFGNEVGLSWYWCGQLILLFMCSFEMFMILCKKKCESISCWKLHGCTFTLYSMVVSAAYAYCVFVRNDSF